MMRTAVVTGAGAGVGRALASEFAKNGWRVALIARGEQRLVDAVAEARAFGVDAMSVSVDVADAEAVDAAAERVERELVRLMSGSTTPWPRYSRQCTRSEPTNFVA